MAEYKEHCADCKRELGKSWEVVHRWLDAFAFSKGMFRPQHRSLRHHSGGVEQVRRMWGDQAARAAEIHIMKDFGGKVPTPNQAQAWSLFGPDGVTKDGASFPTDEGAIGDGQK